MLPRQITMVTTFTFDCDVSSLIGEARRIVLLGKTGVGKSAAGNTILGQKEFRYVRRMNSVTCGCSEKHATVSGRSVSVVDTPGLSHTEMEPEELNREIARSVYLSSPGPHAFLIVIRVTDRFTEQEEEIPQQIEMMFGQEVFKYSIILFTHGDWLMEESIETIMERFPALKRLVDQCGGRFHVFNNKDENNREQVNDLLRKIDTMIEQNGGHYSNQMYEDAYRFRQEEEERKKLQEENESLRIQMQNIRAECEAQRSELQCLKAERQREEEQRKPQENIIAKVKLADVGAVCGGVVGAAVGALASPAAANVCKIVGAALGTAVGATADREFTCNK